MSSHFDVLVYAPFNLFISFTLVPCRASSGEMSNNKIINEMSVTIDRNYYSQAKTSESDILFGIFGIIRIIC